jgi:thymidylate synthase (FAD)
MKIIKPSVTIVHTKSANEIYRSLEEAARICYRSEEKISEESFKKFLESIIKSGHHSVLEHENISVLWEVDRGILAEITRHRLCQFSVESSRYVRYSDPMSFKVIKPYFFVEGTPAYEIWLNSMKTAEANYNNILLASHQPQEARSVLPMSFATLIRMTANIREWRHILTLRTSPGAHPQMREICFQTLHLFKEKFNLLFKDIPSKNES